MGEQSQMTTELIATQAELVSMKQAYVQLQKAYLMQQRELNILQMEKVDALLSNMIDD